MSYYLISDIAKKADLSTDTIRFYEKRGWWCIKKYAKKKQVEF